MDPVIEKLMNDKKKLIDILEKLLDSYVSMKLATMYPNGIDEAYVARVINSIKAKRK